MTQEGGQSRDMTAWSIWRSNSEDGKWRPTPAKDFGRDLSRSHPHYVIHDILGWGGMGAVYLANDRQRSQWVAIKVLRPDQLADEDAVRRFDEEIANLKKLGHTNIVRVFDSGVTVNGDHFFVMELLEGQSLAQLLLRKIPLEPHRVLEIMTDICSGVEHVHQQGLVHRDIKAANIFIVKADGRAVVLDFGVARAIAKPPSEASLLSVPGTEGYIAPEVLQGQPSTPASDVFALGVVFLHMVSGLVPSAGHGWPSEYGFDPRLDGVAQKPLRRNPTERWPSAAQVLHALTDTTGTHGSASETFQQGASTHAPVVETAEVPDAIAQPGTRSVKPPTAARQHLHRSYLARWSPTPHAGRPPSTPVSPAEQWEEVARWNAFPDMPSFEDIQAKVNARLRTRNIAAAAALVAGVVAVLFTAARSNLPWIQAPVLALVAGCMLAWPAARLAGWLFDRWARATMPESVFWDWEGRLSFEIQDYWRKRADANHCEPRLLLWHPHQSYLFAARDHCFLSGWRWEEDRRAGHVYGPSPLVTAQAVFSRGWLKGVVWSETSFLTQAESFWWWKHDLPTDHWIIYDVNGMIRAWIVPRYANLGLFGPLEDGALLCNPWRPKHRNSLLVLPGPDVVATCDPARLPPGKLLLENCSEINSFAAEHINLSKLRLAQQDVVDSYAWHPSGEYVALALGGRIHVLHWESGELVAMHTPPAGETYGARGWNREGSLLALDSDAARVWDARAGIARASQPNERWAIRAEGSLDRKRTSCDGLRSIEGPGFRPRFGVWDEAGSASDAAWSANDPDVFATVGGEGCTRDIRIWRRKATGDEQPAATA
jgi:serine/threonine protein kinase